MKPFRSDPLHPKTCESSTLDLEKVSQIPTIITIRLHMVLQHHQQTEERLQDPRRPELCSRGSFWTIDCSSARTEGPSSVQVIGTLAQDQQIYRAKAEQTNTSQNASGGAGGGGVKQFT